MALNSIKGIAARLEELGFQPVVNNRRIVVRCLEGSLKLWGIAEARVFLKAAEKKIINPPKNE